MRTSQTKTKIVDVLTKSHLLTLAQIHDAIPDVDFSTVFRNVENLLKENVIKKVNLDKGVMYELAKDNHDHFVCDDCGTVESLHVDTKGLKLKSKAKISDVVVHGICENCN